MKFLVIYFLILISSYQLNANPVLIEPYPILDAPQFSQIPRGLRVCKINHLKGVSGSGQFSEQTFEEMTRQLAVNPDKLVVFDLREESHGLINGKAVSWTDGLHNNLNCQKTVHEIEKDENYRLQLAHKNKHLQIKNVEEIAIFQVHEIKTEREFVRQKGAQYIRLPVTDHLPPSDQVLDQFIEYVQQINDKQWIHVHCKAGKGRTTTFLVLLDTMMHANEHSLEEILQRQHFIGGADLKTINKKNEVRTKGAHERLELVKRFYTYCQQVPDFHVNWSTWNQQQSSFVTHP